MYLPAELLSLVIGSWFMTAGGLPSSLCALRSLSDSVVVQNQLIVFDVALGVAGLLGEGAVRWRFLIICTVGDWITWFEWAGSGTYLDESGKKGVKNKMIHIIVSKQASHRNVPIIFSVAFRHVVVFWLQILKQTRKLENMLATHALSLLAKFLFLLIGWEVVCSWFMTAGVLRLSPCAFNSLSGSAVVQNQLIVYGDVLNGSLAASASWPWLTVLLSTCIVLVVASVVGVRLCGVLKTWATGGWITPWVRTGRATKFDEATDWCNAKINKKWGWIQFETSR